MAMPGAQAQPFSRIDVPTPGSRATASCRHCGESLGPDSSGGFCCAGCAAAFEMVKGLGLDSYYRRRVIDAAARPIRPDVEMPRFDFAPYVTQARDGSTALTLAVDGLHCAACVWLIEAVLARVTGVVSARVNMTTRRLRLVWRPEAADPQALVDRVAALGYRLTPFDDAAVSAAADARLNDLLRAMAVAGFAAGNVMLLSVSVWAGQDMGPATRDLMHWVSAAIALPAIAWAGQPFFRPAVAALAAGRVNMDVPISLALVLAAGMSVVQTATGQTHAYFDSALMLLFFLLVGRYLDARARGRARHAAANLLTLGAQAATVIDPDGTARIVAPAALRPGMVVLAAAGERIPVDGHVASGVSDLDTAAITGESVPRAVGPGDAVHAGTINLSAPVRIAVGAVGDDTVLAEIVRLVEAAEQGRSRYVAVADRVARFYAPAVHSLALATLLVWWLVFGSGWQVALLNAIAVLIITCPCALALAVPAVQVVAAGRLLRAGVLIKSATALERLAAVDTIVFDKTGTLTEGRPRLLRANDWTPDDLIEAAGIARASGHPLARALAAAAPGAPVRHGVEEQPARGLRCGDIKLGSRGWCGIDDDSGAAGPELWLTRPGRTAVRFAFRDEPRPDSTAVLRRLIAQGYAVELLSGDRPVVAAAMARRLGIARWRGGCTPAAKAARLAELAAAGRRVLMVGDGLNDAPALSHAHVSMSPATAVDIARNAADIVFLGDRLAPVAESLDVASCAARLVVQNLALAFAYNALTIPLAMAGMVTPLVAAAAMSVSSLVVVGNALRLGRRPRQ